MSAFTPSMISQDLIRSRVCQMFKPIRVVATIIFIASIVLVFVGAFVIGSDVRLLVFPFFPILSHANCCPWFGVGSLPKYVCSSLLFSSADITIAPVFVVIQYLAFTWYCLSYIPYARQAILKMIGMG